MEQKSEEERLSLALEKMEKKHINLFGQAGIEEWTQMLANRLFKKNGYESVTVLFQIEKRHS